jgi:hypothetical protein
VDILEACGEKENKIHCPAPLSDGSPCSILVATNNPTNLKSYLQKHHQ